MLRLEALALADRRVSPEPGENSSLAVGARRLFRKRELKSERSC